MAEIAIKRLGFPVNRRIDHSASAGLRLWKDFVSCHVSTRHRLTATPHAVDVELGALVLADLAPGIDGILLLVEMAAAAGRAVFLDVPAAVGVGHNMM